MLNVNLKIAKNTVSLPKTVGFVPVNTSLKYDFSKSKSGFLAAFVLAKNMLTVKISKTRTMKHEIENDTICLVSEKSSLYISCSQDNSIII